MANFEKSLIYLWQKSQRNFLEIPTLLRDMVKRAIPNRIEFLVDRRRSQLQILSASWSKWILRTMAILQVSCAFRTLFTLLGNRAYVGKERGKHRKRYEEMRFRIGWQRLRRMQSWWKTEIPDFRGNISGILYFAQCTSANSDPGPSAKFRGDGT